MTEHEALSKLADVLREFNVPEEAIETDMSVRIVGGQTMRPDLIIAAPDGVTPLAVFEVKANVKQEDAYRFSALQLGSFLDKGMRAFAVVSDDNDKLMFAQIKRSRWSHVRWRPLSALGESLGSYALESLKVIEKNDINEIRLARFRNRAMVGGIATSAIASLMEFFGHEFSWKVCALLGMTFTLYAASYRIPIKLNVAGNEIEICHKEEKDGAGHAT